MILVADRRPPAATGTGLCASFLFALAVLLAGCGGEQAALVFSGQTMGTSYHIKVVPGEVPVPGDIEAGVFAALDAVDRAMTTYDDQSELMRLNRAPLGEAFPVSAPLFEVLAIAHRVYRDSAGAFDPTVGPLVDLWGFGPAPGDDRVPSDGAIDALRANLGYDALGLDAEPPRATRRRDIRLDLSAVAKGYGADRAAAYLRGLGFDDFMVEVGGEMALAGHNAEGKPWQVAVETPTSDGRGIQRIIGVSDAGLATSGDYRNYFERDGVRFSHTIDPRSGRPIRHGLASVTVIMPTAAEADALATAFMVMGEDEALRLAEARDIPLFLLVKEGDGFAERWSRAFAPYLGAAGEEQP
jgi:thiamine biosynthesis lipoprotein